MLKENYININFYKKEKEEKALQVFTERDYKKEDLMLAIEEIQDDIFCSYEDSKYVIDMTFYNYDKEYNSHFIADIKCFTCYSDDGCLRLNLDSNLKEDIDYCFFDSYGFWFEDFLKEKDNLPKEKVSKIYSNYDKAYDFIKEFEEDKVFKAFKNLIEG